MALAVTLSLKLDFTPSLQSHISNCLSAYRHSLPFKNETLALYHPPHSLFSWAWSLGIIFFSPSFSILCCHKSLDPGWNANRISTVSSLGRSKARIQADG